MDRDQMPKEFSEQEKDELELLQNWYDRIAQEFKDKFEKIPTASFFGVIHYKGGTATFGYGCSACGIEDMTAAVLRNPNLLTHNREKH